jgi:hypothetical protein
VAASHVADHVRGVVAGHPGGCDKQWVGGVLSAQYWHGVGGGGEGGLGHADHRDAEFSVRVRTQAGPGTGVEVGVAVDPQEAQTARTARIGGSSR